MRLTVHTTESAPAESRPVLAGIQADLGFVPNLAAATADSPALIQGFDGLRRAVATTKVDPVAREVAGLAVGVAVDNAYGVAFHSTMLAKLGVDKGSLTAMRAGTSPADPVLATVYDFARQLVTTRGKVDDVVVQRLTDNGLSTADILDLVAECAFASLVGLVDNLAGRVTLDAFLALWAWTA
jgi:alkylhydroperoxidase family enzyme